jgi:outer membrane protein insertion porin family
MEAGNNFLKVKDFNAFDMKRSVGVGVRVFLPMFGLLGVDYGYGLDIVPASPKRGNLHVSIGQQF